MVEHLLSCVVVDNTIFQEPRHVLNFCSTQIFIQYISCQFAHCVARMNILYAVFNSEILCSHICENPRIRLGPFLDINNHIIHVYSYILLTIHLM